MVCKIIFCISSVNTLKSITVILTPVCMWLYGHLFSTTPSTNFAKGIMIMPTEHKITVHQCPLENGH